MKSTVRIRKCAYVSFLQTPNYHIRAHYPNKHADYHIMKEKYLI